MSLTHPRTNHGHHEELAVQPLFGLEGTTIPRDAIPGRGAVAGRRVPDHPRRADARRERAAQRRDVRDDLDGAAGAAADDRVLRQEHDRQGRVPADRGDRGALREDAQPALARAGGRRGDRLLDHRLERGRDARRAGAEAPVDAAAPGRGKAGRPAEPRDGHQRPGVLGEVRQLLGRRDAPRADGGRPLPHVGGGGREALRREHDRRRRDPRLDLRRLLRAGGGDLPGARRVPGRDGARHPGPRRRGLRRVRRAVRRPGPGLGLPARRASRRSTPRATSTGSCTPASAGSSGATAPRCPRT